MLKNCISRLGPGRHPPDAEELHFQDWSRQASPNAEVLHLQAWSRQAPSGCSFELSHSRHPSDPGRHVPDALSGLWDYILDCFAGAKRPESDCLEFREKLTENESN